MGTTAHPGGPHGRSTRFLIPLIIAGLFGLVLILAVRPVGGRRGRRHRASTDPSGSAHRPPRPRGLHDRVDRGLQREGRAARARSPIATTHVQPEVDGSACGCRCRPRPAVRRRRPWPAAGTRPSTGPGPTSGRPARARGPCWSTRGPPTSTAPVRCPRSDPASCRPRWSSPCPSRWPRPSAGRRPRSAGRTSRRSPRPRRGGPRKDHPEWGRFKLGKTNPYFSTSGLNATIASYFAATGVSSDLTVSAGRRPGDAGVRQAAGVLRRPLRRHHADLPGQHEPGGSRRAGPDLRLGGDRRGEVGPRLQPGQPDRRPGDPGRPAAPPRSRWPRSTPPTGRCVSDNPWIMLDADWVDDAEAPGGG